MVRRVNGSCVFWSVIKELEKYLLADQLPEWKKKVCQFDGDMTSVPWHCCTAPEVYEARQWKSFAPTFANVFGASHPHAKLAYALYYDLH